MAVKCPTWTKKLTAACDGEKRVCPDFPEGPKAGPMTEPDYLSPDCWILSVETDPLMILPAKEASCVCIPGPTCETERSCECNSVSGGSTDNVTASDDHCASNEDGSCHEDEPAKYKTSDVTGDSHSSGYSSTGVPHGYKLGYKPNN